MMPPAQKAPVGSTPIACGARFGPVSFADRTGEGKAVDIYLDRGNGNSISTSTTPETLADWIEDGIFKGTDETASDLDFPPPETWPWTHIILCVLAFTAGIIAPEFF